MKSIRYSFLSILIICFLTGGLAGQGFHITLSVPDLPDKEVILSHRLGLKFYTDDTVKTDAKGYAVFEAADRMPEGMYQLVFPDKKFAEFFLDKNQIFSISTWSASPSDSLSFSGSPENSRFLDWQHKYSISRNRTALVQARLKKGNLSPDSTRLFNQELQQIQHSNSQLWDSTIQYLAGTLPGKFIKGLKPVRIPESMGRPDTQEDQLKQYQYLKTHFFDGVDFTDERLIRTPLIETKLDQYFKQIAPPVADSIIQDARRIIELSKAAKSMYQVVVQYLFNLYSDPEIMGTDAVYVYIAENYYLAGQAPWIDSANLRGISYRVKELKPLLLGKVAPVLDGLYTMDEQPFEIETVKSKYLILYFWSPDCGFCKETAPKFYAQYADLKQMGIEVVALNTRLDKGSWVKFITDNQLGWLNLYSPQKARDLVEKYQAFTTPALYILDYERHIIAKSISYDQVKPFMIQYLASHK